MKKQNKVFNKTVISVIVFLMLLWLFSAAASGEVITMIKAEDLAKRIKHNDDFLMVDVRQPDELTGSLGHISGSVNIPMLSLNSRISKVAGNKNREIILVCRSDHRARFAADMLKRAGFTNLKVLEGGMMRWNKLGLPASKERAVVNI